MRHSCVGQNEAALIAHPWRFDDHFETWVRDDCVEKDLAYAAIVHIENSRYAGPPAADGSLSFYDNVEDAKTAHDIQLLKRGWTLVDELDP